VTRSYFNITFFSRFFQFYQILEFKEILRFLNFLYITCCIVITNEKSKMANKISNKLRIVEN